MARDNIITNYDRSISFYRPTHAIDGRYGTQSVSANTLLATVWAAKEYGPTNNESELDEKVTVQDQVMWHIRWPDGWTPNETDYITDQDGRNYDISSIREKGRAAGCIIKTTQRR